MAKITFPSVIDTDYRGWISEVRNQLVMWKSKIELSPDAEPELVRQINALLLDVGYGFADGTDILVRNSADSKEVTGDAVVDETTGTLTEVALPSTWALVNSTMALTGVTPTGTYATTVTFTVANGVISAIALS